MTATELRELDAWIAVNLFEWIATDVKTHPSDNRTIGGVLFSPKGCNYDLNQGSCVAQFTTDPSAAMQVWKKCLELAGCDIVFFKSTDKLGHYRVFSIADIMMLATPGAGVDYVEAETIELAICLFAKKRFSK